MSKTTRVFGNDTIFWSDKPIQKGHPSYKEKIKWYHIHWYNTPYHPVHKSADGSFIDVVKSKCIKCRCGKVNNVGKHKLLMICGYIYVFLIALCMLTTLYLYCR